VSGAVRKLRRRGDVDGLLARARAEEADRSEALDAIIELGADRPASVRAAREGILHASRGWVHDTDPRTRASALSLLLLLRDPGTEPIVVAALSDPRSDGARAGSAWGLPPAATRLPRRRLRLLADADPHVRSFAAAALERVGDRGSVRSLIDARDRERDPNVRERMAEVVDIMEGRRPPTPIESFMKDA
jgi:HEAT repeat protein